MILLKCQKEKAHTKAQRKRQALEEIKRKKTLLRKLSAKMKSSNEGKATRKENLKEKTLLRKSNDILNTSNEKKTFKKATKKKTLLEDLDVILKM